MCTMLYLTVQHSSEACDLFDTVDHTDYNQDYQLDFDNLTVNAINTLNSDTHTLSHCPNLIQYVIKIKNSKLKLTAMLDCGSGV